MLTGQVTHSGKQFQWNPNKTTLKYVWDYKRLRLAKAIMIKNYEVRGIAFSSFRWHYKDIT